jgi:hypothetical protein
MARPSLVGALSAIIVVLVGACSGSERSRSEETGGTGDSAKSIAATPTPRQVSVIMIGKGSGNRVTEPTFQFAPQDTVYLSVATQGSGGANSVSAAWRSQNGEIVQQSSEAIPPGGESVAFTLAQPKGLKPGTYKVVVFLGDDSVAAKVFVVKK